MPKLTSQLVLSKCPHCFVDAPSLNKQAGFTTNSLEKNNARNWGIYACARCGGVVSASVSTTNAHGEVKEIYPRPRIVDDAIPAKARTYLDQALSSLQAPAGAVMLAASAVDAMLKEMNYKTGSLYERINQAAADNKITEEMAKWAHKVRLDANDQRHADESVTLPTEPEARMIIEFALALGEFLFVLPERVRKGMNPTTS